MASFESGSRSHAVDASFKAKRERESLSTRADNALRQERMIDATDLAKGDTLSDDELQLDVGGAEPWWKTREIAKKQQAEAQTKSLRDTIARMPDNKQNPRPPMRRAA